jgi:hypothetical protein
MPRLGNPKAKEAMKLVHSRGITLKQAWDYVKSGKEPTPMCPCPGEKEIPPPAYKPRKTAKKQMVAEDIPPPSYKPRKPTRGEGYEKISRKYADKMRTRLAP